MWIRLKDDVPQPSIWKRREESFEFFIMPWNLCSMAWSNVKMKYSWILCYMEEGGTLSFLLCLIVVTLQGPKICQELHMGYG